LRPEDYGANLLNADLFWRASSSSIYTQRLYRVKAASSTDYKGNKNKNDIAGKRNQFADIFAEYKQISLSSDILDSIRSGKMHEIP
jgi:hypothetical protein